MEDKKTGDKSRVETGETNTSSFPFINTSNPHEKATKSVPIIPTGQPPEAENKVVKGWWKVLVGQSEDI